MRFHLTDDLGKKEICDRIEGDSILLFSPKEPFFKDKVHFEEWGSHRAYMVKAKGGGGRKPVAIVERQARKLDENKLRKYARQ